MGELPTQLERLRMAAGAAAVAMAAVACGGPTPTAAPPLAVPAVGTESSFWWTAVTASVSGCSLPAALLFAVDSAVLTAPGRAALAPLVPLLRRATGTIVIAGFTDSTGTAAHNLALSLARAESVAAALAAAGLPAARVRAVGIGAGQPAARNDTGSGRALNRRVEVRFKRAAPQAGEGVSCAG